METAFCQYYKSPIGLIEIQATEHALTSLVFAENKSRKTKNNHILKQTKSELDEYFNKKRKVFDIPILFLGTDFQASVWYALMSIPFGSVTSYHDIAIKLGNPKAVRAVGAANGRNPVSIIVPCHRVLGMDDSLTGYAGGIWRKEWLLKHEGYLML
jgi:methylated-DNA-[protein]-cysteine S-methyltransferase